MASLPHHYLPWLPFVARHKEDCFYLWSMVKASEAGKNFGDIAYVFANNFRQCKYCFTDLAGKDSLSYGDVAMPLWHPYPTTTCLGFLLRRDKNRIVSLCGVWSRQVRQAKTLLISLMFFANNFHQCKHCFTDLVGKDSLAYGDVAMPL